MVGKLLTYLVLLSAAPPVLAASDQLITVVTFNTGMLDKLNPVPFYNERIRALKSEFKDLLDQEKVDVVAVQEAWTKETSETFRHLDQNYVYIEPQAATILPFFYNPTGLGFLVKKNLHPTSSFNEYPNSHNWVCLWGMLCKRGIFSVEIKPKGGQPLTLSTTHLTPLVTLTKYRKSELVTFSQFAKDLLNANRELIVLGDFNLSSRFGSLKQGDDGDRSLWSRNADLYNNLAQLAGQACHDSYTQSDQGYEFTQNREENLTAAISPSAGKAPSQRNDMILICTFKKWILKQHKIVFSKPIQLNGNRFHLSDHFGVLSTFGLQ